MGGDGGMLTLGMDSVGWVWILSSSSLVLLAHEAASKRWSKLETPHLTHSEEIGLVRLKILRTLVVLSNATSLFFGLNAKILLFSVELPCALCNLLTMVVLIATWSFQGSLLLLPTSLGFLLVSGSLVIFDWTMTEGGGEGQITREQTIRIICHSLVMVLTTGWVVVELIMSAHIESLLDDAKARQESRRSPGEAEEEPFLELDEQKPPKPPKPGKLAKQVEATRMYMASRAFQYVIPSSTPLRARLAGCFFLVALERGVNIAVPLLYKHMVDTLSQVSSLQSLLGASSADTTTSIPSSSFLPLQSLSWHEVQRALSAVVLAAVQRVSFWSVFHPWVLAYLAAWFLRGGSGMEGLLSSCRDVLWAPITQAAYRAVSLDVVGHLLELDHSFHVKRKTGTILRILDRGTSAIQDTVAIVLFNVIPQMADIIVSCVYLATAMEPWAAGIVAVTVASYIPLTVFITERRGAVRKRMNALDNAREARATDMLLNYETVKLFSAEKLELSQYDSATRQYQSAEYWQLAFLSVLAIAQGCVVWAGLVAGTCVCIQGVINGSLTVGDAVLFITLMNQLYVPLTYFGSYYRQVQKALIDVENLFQLLATKPKVQELPGAKPLMVVSGAIEFREVWFGYGKQPPPTPQAHPQQQGQPEDINPRGQVKQGKKGKIQSPLNSVGAISLDLEEGQESEHQLRQPLLAEHSGHASQAALAPGQLNGSPHRSLKGASPDKQQIKRPGGHESSTGKQHSTIAHRRAGSWEEATESDRASPSQAGKHYMTGDQAAESKPAPEPVLAGLSFSLPGGKTLAVVGATGSGKSTILKLILRFYDPWKGAVLIDGQDISKLSIASVRKRIAVVPQDSILFNQSVAYNIRYGAPGASMEEVEEAAAIAQIHESVVVKFKKGYATRVGERGIKLSGGEKQRIAFARAVIKKPAILVLDEATSALDSITEAAISTSLALLRQQCTTVIVAHRLSTVQDADVVLVMHEGRVAECGSPSQLLANNSGLYSQMWARQLTHGREVVGGWDAGGDSKAFAKVTPDSNRSARVVQGACRMRAPGPNVSPGAGEGLQTKGGGEIGWEQRVVTTPVLNTAAQGSEPHTSMSGHGSGSVCAPLHGQSRTEELSSHQGQSPVSGLMQGLAGDNPQGPTRWKDAAPGVSVEPFPLRQEQSNREHTPRADRSASCTEGAGFHTHPQMARLLAGDCREGGLKEEQESGAVTPVWSRHPTPVRSRDAHDIDEDQMHATVMAEKKEED